MDHTSVEGLMIDKGTERLDEDILVHTAYRKGKDRLLRVVHLLNPRGPFLNRNHISIHYVGATYDDRFDIIYDYSVKNLSDDQLLSEMDRLFEKYYKELLLDQK